MAAARWHASEPSPASTDAGGWLETPRNPPLTPSGLSTPPLPSSVSLARNHRMPSPPRSLPPRPQPSPNLSDTTPSSETTSSSSPPSHPTPDALEPPHRRHLRPHGVLGTTAGSRDWGRRRLGFASVRSGVRIVFPHYTNLNLERGLTTKDFRDFFCKNATTVNPETPSVLYY